MQRRWYTQLSGMTLVGLLTLTGVGVLGFRPAAHADGGGIEGTWISAVKIVSCDDPDVVFATFESMVTYMRGGTLIEGGGPGTPPPAVSRSAGHGIWERTGDHTFHAFFRFHSFDNLGRLVRISEVTTNPELIRGDNPDTPEVEPYYLSVESINKITNINPVDGSVIEPVIEGCSGATQRPVLFQD